MKIKSETKSLISGSIISVSARVLDLSLRYFMLFLIARNLGVDLMGRYTLLIGILLVFVEIGRAGLDTVMLKLGSEYYAQGRLAAFKNLYLTLLKNILLIGGVLSILLFLFAPFIAETLFNKPHLDFSLQVISLAVLPYILLYFHAQAFRAMKRIIPYSLSMEIAVPLLAIIFLLLPLPFVTPDGVILIFMLGSILFASSATYLFWAVTSPLKDITRDNTPISQEIWQIAKPFITSIFASISFNWAGIFIIGNLFLETDIAIFNIALKVALLASIPLLAVETVSGPQIAALFKNYKNDALKEYIQKATLLTMLIGVPIVLFLVFFGKYFLAFFDETLIASYPLMVIILLGQVVNIFTGPVSLVLTMTDRQIQFRNIILLSGIVTILLNYFFILKWGIYGAAWATVLSTIYKNLLFYLAVRKRFGFSSISISLPIKLLHSFTNKQAHT